MRLFDVSSKKEDDTKTTNRETLNSVKKEPEKPTEKRRRGRPKKVVSEPPKKVQEEKPKKESNTEKPITVSTAKPDRGWKDFNETKPEPLVPCEFYVDMGSDKRDIFTGYIKEKGCTVTDEPYKMVVLRKKYGNLFYREISGCSDIMNCPNNYPSCNKCPTAKRKLLK